jgi:hypothetical protein
MLKMKRDEAEGLRLKHAFCLHIQFAKNIRRSQVKDMKQKTAAKTGTVLCKDAASICFWRKYLFRLRKVLSSRSTFSFERGNCAGESKPPQFLQWNCYWRVRTSPLLWPPFCSSNLTSVSVSPAASGK